MTRRIYKAICTVAVVVFICSLALIMELLYNYFSLMHLNQMKELALLLIDASESDERTGRCYCSWRGDKRK